MEIGRHQRKCSVCSHPELRAIEKDYLGWVTMAECARRYSLPKNSMGDGRIANHDPLLVLKRSIGVSDQDREVIRVEIGYDEVQCAVLVEIHKPCGSRMLANRELWAREQGSVGLGKC